MSSMLQSTQQVNHFNPNEFSTLTVDSLKKLAELLAQEYEPLNRNC